MYNKEKIKNSSNISKTTWSLVKIKLGINNQPQKNEEIKIKEKLVKDPHQIAEHFNGFFY